jgi:hypothetical protein
MAYTDFSLEQLLIQFGIVDKVKDLFGKKEPLLPSDWLLTTLEKSSTIHARTEKAKSETIVFPILLELKDRNKDFIAVFSGDNLNADAEKGLRGECDFIITKNIGSYEINYPIIQLVEAKNHDIDLGIPQCAAQMLGAKIFNQKRNVSLEYIYGCVTTGDDWLFLRLGEELVIDTRKYYLNELGELLSVFQSIIDYYKQTI